MFGFNVNKLKPNLKMAVHRIGIIKNKKAIVAKAQRKEVAALLAEGKEEKARIRVGILVCITAERATRLIVASWFVSQVEGIIRDDFTVEGYEIIELLCDLIAERAVGLCGRALYLNRWRLHSRLPPHRTWCNLSPNVRMTCAKPSAHSSGRLVARRLRNWQRCVNGTHASNGLR